MKGIVFTEFLEMVEEKFGYDTVDEIISKSNLASNGIYTAIGTYDHAEIVELITQLQIKTGIAVPDLLKTYGRYLHGTFTNNYNQFFSSSDNAFDFLETIDNHIHVEVKKLYPDAQLPKFSTRRINSKTLEMIYSSKRKMSDFAEGLIDKTLEYYNQKATIEKTIIEADGSVVKFKIKLLD